MKKLITFVLLLLFSICGYTQDIAISLVSSPEGAGTLNGGGNYAQGQTCTINATANEGYVFSKWKKVGNEVSSLPTYSFTVSATAQYTAYFKQLKENDILIGEPTSASNGSFPTSTSPYSLTQQIYTAEELNTGACQISSLSFFNSGQSRQRNLTIYMVNTTKTSFESNTDWIAVNSSDMVFNGTFNMSYHDWSTVYFNTPFDYDGSSNIALIIDDNTGTQDNYYYTYSRVCNTQSTQAIIIAGYSENYDPYHTTAYNGTRASVKNQIIFGIPDYEFTASAIADPYDGGSVSGGGGLYYYGQPIPFTATANEGYVFNYWTRPNGNYPDLVVSCMPSDYLPVISDIQYTAHFQEMDGLIVGGAEHTNQYLPLCGYPYTLSQQIYTADELNTSGCEISSVSFFNTGYGSYEDHNILVYLVSTTKTAFDSNSDWIEVTDEDIVFSGPVYSGGKDWVTLYFDNAFSYDGSSNLALVVRNETGEWGGGMSCRTFNTETHQALYAFNEYDAITNGDEGTLVLEKNQVVFGIASYDYTMTLSADPEEGGTVSGGEGQYYYGQPILISATPNPGYVFNNWSKQYSEYEYGYEYEEPISYLSSDHVSVSESNHYVAHFEQKEGIIIGQADKIGQTLPVYYYPNSMSQQIYTAAEMGRQGQPCQISSVSFFNTEYEVTRNLDVYMVNTTKSSFAGSNDWIAVTEGNLVFSGDITLEGYGWATIYFSTPFSYDGSSNVALVVNDKTGQWVSESFCRTFDTQGMQALYIYDENNSIDPCHPSSYTGERLSEKNQVVFGIANYDYSVTVSANPTAGGTAIGGGGQYYYGQPIPLSATTNPGYAFSSWTKGSEEVVSCFPDFTLSVTETAEYVANFKEVDGILIGEPVQASSYLPTNYYSFYALTQQIYAASELNANEPCEISSISFFNAGDGRTRKLDVYLVQTDKTSFESNTDWISVDSTDLLFSGNVTFPSKSWTTIYFTKPFNYDGGSNVALIVDDNTNGYYHSYGSENFKCRSFNTEAPQTLCISCSTSSSSTDYDPYHPESYSGSCQSVKSQIIFGYAHYDYNVTASANPLEGGEVGGDIGIHYYGQPITLTATPSSSYVFNKWTKNSETVSYFSTYNFPVTETAEYMANFQQMEGIAIGDAVSTNNYLPGNTYYYSMSQQIYTATEMGGEERQISSVSFFHTGTARSRNYTIYLVHTDKTAFESNTDWITVTEADKVFEGNVTYTAGGWTTINFNEVFYYDGLSNIALIVDDNSGTYLSSLNCRTFNTEENQAICVSNNTNFDPYNPSAYNGTRYTMKNQVVFGPPSYDYTVTSTVNPAEGGTVSGGGEGYYLGQLCTLTATANEGYLFYNWTLNGTVVSSDNPYTFPVTGNMNMVANFGPPIVVTVTANPTDGGTVSDGGEFGYNHSCTITATANPGYVFTTWTKNGSVVSCLSSYTFNVREAAEYVANFEQVNNGVAVGDAISTNSYLPYNYYPHSFTQQIYTANELNIGPCEISSVSLFGTSTGAPRKLTIYMINTDKSTFESNTDWIAIDSSDIVFDGTFTSSYRAWSTLYFNRIFSYDGSSNIALIVDDHTNDSYGSTYYRVFNTENTQAIRFISYNGGIDHNNLTVYNGTLLSMKNQIIFGFPSYGYTATVSANPAEGGTVSGGGGNYFYGQNIPVNATPNPGYVFNKWTRNGTAVSYLSVDNVSVTGTAEFVANFQQMEGIAVGEAISTNRNLPTYGYYYGISEQIYTAAEMGGAPHEISSVSFFNTESSRYRIFDVYMAHTNKTSFASETDWITVTEADKLFSGSVTMEGYGWTTIYFATPFDYDGTSNVVLVVDDNTNSYNSGMKCRTFSTEGSQAIYTYASDIDFDPCGLGGYYGSLVQEKNQVVFGTASYDYTVSISIDPVEGGMVLGGEGPCYYGQPVTVSVAANPGYVFNKWTKHIVQNGYEYDEDVSYLSTDVITVTESTDFVAHFQQTDDIIIGEAIHTCQHLPSSYSYYSMSQQIFTADEMNASECDISSVSFFNTDYSGTRNLEIYMVNISKTEFTGSNDWIAVTEEDKVFSGNVSFPGHNWTTVYFITPFHYDGSSDVVLVVNDKSGNWSTRYCRTFDTQGTQAIYTTGSNAFDPSNPSGYSGNLLTEKNQVVFGIASYDYSVSVSANPAEGGSVVGGGGPYYYGQPIPLAASANSGYAFSTWTKGNEVVSCFPEFTLNVTETAEYVANFKDVDGILIGEPSHYNSYVPTYYHNSFTEQIYTAAEMGGQSCQISSVSFFNTGTYTKTRNLDIYMVHTNKTAFESNTDWVPVTATDTVLFSGNITFSGKSWITIYFDKPFYYDGSSNVVLIVDDNSNSANHAEIRCRTFDSEDNQVLRVSNSGNTNYDPNNPTNYTGSLLSEKNQVIFGYAHYDYLITAAANPAVGGNVAGITGAQYYGRPITLTATPNPGFVFNNWTKNGEVISYFSTYSFSVTETADFVANFQQFNGRAIGDAVSNSYSLPTYPYYYSLSQQIYTAAEMGNMVQAISSVSFFNTGTAMTRKFDIYLVHTDKNVFDNNTDWITVTEADKVFSGNVEMLANGWTTINFNKVFDYNGSSNVALIVDDNSNSYNPSLTLRCRTFNTEGNQSLYISHYNMNFDPCNPITSSGTLAMQKNHIVFGYPSYVYSVSAMASPAEAGTVSGGGVGYFLGQLCTLTATTTNPNYRFYNWSMNGYVVSYDATYTFPVTGNMFLVANFGTPVNVSVSANPAEGGSVSGGGGYGLNQTCTLTAVANPGYVFTKWTKGTSSIGISYLSTYTFTVTEAADYVANFDQVNNGVAIGDAVSTNSYLPTCSYSKYSMSQQIYTAAEMGGTENEISSVSFFNAGSSSTRNLTIYMVHTDKSTFADGTDWISFSDADMVFNGSVYFRSHERINIYFATPFNYDGTSNVALIVDDNTGSSDYGTSCRTFGTNGNQAIYVNSSNTDYDANNLSGITGTILPEKNQVVFGFASYDYYVTLSANPINGGTVSGGGGPYYLGQPCTVTASPNTNAGYCFYYWKYNGAAVSTSAEYTFRVMNNMNLIAYFGAPIQITATANSEEGGTVTGAGDYGYYHACTLTAIPSPGYVFNYWLKNGEVISYFSTYSFTVYNAADYVAVFESVTPNIAIGDAESSSYLPNSSSYYTLSQQIYTAEEIGMPGEIHSVSFFNTSNYNATRSYTIYMKHTDKTAFGSQYDWVPISETDQVFSGNVTLTGGTWTEITFDTPFQYDGTSNVVLVVNDNTGSSGWANCRVFNTGSYQTTVALTNSNSIDPYSTSHYGNRSTSKNQIILGFTPLSVTQTIALSQGVNWFSTNVEITLEDLQAALVAALPGASSITITSQSDGQTTYNGTRWRGQLNTFDVSQMYKINVGADCEMVLEGMPVNPANHSMTIHNGSNWIGFPLNESMTLTNAFAEFATNGDMVVSQSNGSATFTNGRWRGSLTTLEPGKGYNYKSVVTGTRTLTFPTSAGVK